MTCPASGKCIYLFYLFFISCKGIDEGRVMCLKRGIIKIKIHNKTDEVTEELFQSRN